MDIKEILNDLYEFDPGLRNHEKDILHIVERLIAVKPETKIDQAFVEKLRQEIKLKSDSASYEAPNFQQKYNLFFMKKIVYAFASLAVIAILASTTYVLVGKNKQSKLSDLKSPGEISAVADSAFGKLSLANSSAVNPEMLSSRSAVGLGGGGQQPLTANSSAQPVANQSAPNTTITSEKIAAPGVDAGLMPPYYYVNYRYVYKGEDFSVNEDEMEVYRRIHNSKEAKDLATLVSGYDFSLVSPKNFSNLDVPNLYLSEDKEYGYAINYNFQNNQASIYQNYPKWPNPYANCRDEACYASNNLTKNDVPEEAELFSIARDFLIERGISLEGYGEPQIVESYRIYTIMRADYTENYIPETIMIVFPLKIKGEMAHDQSGNLTGLTVDVNIRYKKVASVNFINSQFYEESKYGVVTDKDKLVSIAENGGLYPVYQDSNASETIDIEIGTPTFGLMQYYKYEPNNYTSDELYIPALIFPITKRDDRVYIYQNNIVVPLIADFINQEPTPMPLMERATTIDSETVTSSTGTSTGSSNSAVNEVNIIK